MTETVAVWLYILALTVPPAVVLLGAFALLTPTSERKARHAAPRHSHAHA
jgi:hypothetical protein